MTPPLETPSATTPRVPPLPRRCGRRRVVFFALAAVVVCCVIELGAWTAWWLATGAAFTWQRASDARAAARAGTTWTGPETDANVTEFQRLAIAHYVPHPYLGYVCVPAASRSGKISSSGLPDDASPLRKRAPDRFIVGIVGGSVSWLLCEHAEATLTAALQRSPRLHGRRVEVVRLGLGGYKQPQQ